MELEEVRRIVRGAQGQGVALLHHSEDRVRVKMPVVLVDLGTVP